MDILFALATGILFGIGVFQLLRRDLLKAAMGFGILFTAVNLFYLAVGAYDGEVPPYTEQATHGQVSDPLVQALILTAIVVGFGSYALLLGMINTASKRYGTLDSDEVSELKG
ncbi:MAG: cation:proton antiporter [Chloroflexi bacterium]|nr:MAG: cation:proton antiporter [Chloroflexota bacterium]